VVTAFFERLGNAGVLLVAGALLLGGLAGGAVVYHYERTSTSSVASQHQDGKGKDKQKKPKKNGQGQQKNANRPHQQSDQEAPEQPDTD